MFSFIKSLFGDSPRPAVVPKSSNPTPVEPVPAPPPPRRVAAPTVQSSAGACLEIPLAVVTDRLNPALRSHLLRSPSPADMLKLPLATALEQLPRGAVRLSFRELRQCTPGLFMGGNELDESIVDLPLAEVVSRLSPKHLVRRGEQRPVALPEEIPAVFSSRNGGLTRSSHEPTAGIVEAPTDELASSRMVGQRGSSFEPPKHAAPVFGTATTRPTVPSMIRPAAPAAAREGGSRIPPAAVVPAVSPKPRSEPAPAAESEPIKVALVSLARNWPEPLRRDVLATHLAASVNIPYPELESALKRGKAVFTWKQIRMWLSPKQSTTLAEHDAASLELPLPVLTPLFMARRAPGQQSRTVQSHADIPDVFSARRAEEPPSAVVSTAPAAMPVERPAAADPLDEMPIRVPVVAAPAKGSAAAATPGLGAVSGPDKLTMARSNPLPTEVVQRACHLSGVSGAVIATPDGLVIASQMPPRMCAEKAAGFLPQIYNRLGQYTRELKMGEPSQVEMIVENVPLQIFKTPSAYFAVLGKPGESLPKLQLGALAAQLSARTN